jgi:hypothetical protein
VTLAFGFEGIDDETTRTALFRQSIEWLLGHCDDAARARRFERLAGE